MVNTESSPFYSSRFLNPRISTLNRNITPWRWAGIMPWKQTIHLTCKWKLYNHVKITSLVQLFNRLERLQNFCANRINDRNDGYFSTQLFNSSILSVCPYACNVQSKHSTKIYENSLNRNLPPSILTKLLLRRCYGPVSAERSNEKSIAILLANIKTTAIYMPLTLSKLKVKINLSLWLIKRLATRFMGH
jgi:hypothetical protein